MRRCFLFVAVAAVAAALTGCSDDGSDEACPDGTYDSETYVAITEEMIATARAIAVDAAPEVQAIVDAVGRFHDEQDTFRDVDECEAPDAAEDYVLTIHWLIAHPETASPQLLTRLQEAGNPRQSGAPGGINGIHLVLEDVGSFRDTEYPGIEALRARLAGG